MKPGGRDDGHKFDYSKINDQIFIGSDFCQAGVCLIHEEEFKTLGVDIEINLSKEENELPPKGLESYVWLPTADGSAPTQTQFDIGSAVINEAVNQDKKVYVHCKNGHGRSPSLVAAYLIRFKSYTLQEAADLIKNDRPESHIEESQIKALREYSLRWK